MDDVNVAVAVVAVCPSAKTALANYLGLGVAASCLSRFCSRRLLFPFCAALVAAVVAAAVPAVGAVALHAQSTMHM